jgi:hypothetical protein
MLLPLGALALITLYATVFGSQPRAYVRTYQGQPQTNHVCTHLFESRAVPCLTTLMLPGLRLS